LNPHFGNDGGLFLRSNAIGKSYQATIDYLSGSTRSIGGVFGESGLHPINFAPYGFVAPTVITLTPNWFLNGSNGRPNLTASDWPTLIWKAGSFNTFQARIYNDVPPRIDTWINTFQMIHYQDPSIA